MLVPNQIFTKKWNKSNKNYYESRGYIFTRYGEYFEVVAEDLSIGCHDKVKVKCDYCGKIIDVVWKDYISYRDDMYSCQSCRQTKTSKNTLLDRRENLFIRAKSFCDQNGYIIVTDKNTIQGWDSEFTYICPFHGKQITTVGALSIKHGCTKCARELTAEKLRLPSEEIIKMVSKYNGIVLNVDEYKAYNTKNLKMICNECGAIFTTSLGTYMKNHGQRCPECSRRKIYKGENKIELFLSTYNINYIPQKKFDDCKYKMRLPFDFYLPDHNIAIEYDGEFHYIPIQIGNMTENDAIKRLEIVQLRDKIKTEYCKNNNIELLRIPYWNFEDINNILYQCLID